MIAGHLTKAQQRIVDHLNEGAVIGETTWTHSGALSYELFERDPYWLPKHSGVCEHPFIVTRINKKSVFALLALGLIQATDMGEQMLPFCRDNWYVLTGRQA